MCIELSLVESLCVHRKSALLSQARSALCLLVSGISLNACICCNVPGQRDCGPHLSFYFMRLGLCFSPLRLAANSSAVVVLAGEENRC